MKTRDCLVQFRNHGLYHLPKGLRVKPADHGEYFLDEFPEWMFPENSLELHDAIHYGLRLKESDVEPEHISPCKQ